MSSITDLILSQVKNAAGNIEIPAQLQETVFKGLTSSVTGALTQTAAQAGGLDQIKALLSGATAAAESPVTALAGNLFSKDVLSKLKLGDATNAALKNLVPTITGKLGSIFKDRDGDGDVDLNDILLSLGGGNSGGLLGAATSLLGNLFKK